MLNLFYTSRPIFHFEFREMRSRHANFATAIQKRELRVSQGGAETVFP